MKRVLSICSIKKNKNLSVIAYLTNARFLVSLLKIPQHLLKLKLLLNYLDVLCASQEHLPSTDLGGIVLLHQRRFEYM